MFQAQGMILWGGHWESRVQNVMVGDACIVPQISLVGGVKALHWHGSKGLHTETILPTPWSFCIPGGQGMKRAPFVLCSTVWSGSVSSGSRRGKQPNWDSVNLVGRAEGLVTL